MKIVLLQIVHIKKNYFEVSSPLTCYSLARFIVVVLKERVCFHLWVPNLNYSQLTEFSVLTAWLLCIKPVFVSHLYMHNK